MTKFLPSDQSSGYEQVEKLCADEERPGFSYYEGCDTISVPFKQRECYCKQNLCNSSVKNGANFKWALLPGILGVSFKLLRF